MQKNQCFSGPFAKDILTEINKSQTCTLITPSTQILLIILNLKMILFNNFILQLNSIKFVKSFFIYCYFFLVCVLCLIRKFIIRIRKYCCEFCVVFFVVMKMIFMFMLYMSVRFTEELSCNFSKNILHAEKTNESGLTYDLVIYKNFSRVQIICKSNLEISHQNTINMLLTNDTLEIKQTIKLYSNNTKFELLLTTLNFSFLRNDFLLFSKTSWHFSCFNDSGNVIVSGVIKKISKLVIEMFFIPLNTEMINPKRVHLPCNRNVEFAMRRYVQSGELPIILKIFNYVIGGAYFYFYNTINRSSISVVNGTVSDVVMTTDGLYLLINEALYYGNTIHLYKISTLPYIRRIFYMPLCNIITPLDKHLEAMVLITRNKSRSILHSQYPFHDWHTLNLHHKDKNSSIVSLVHDPERCNFVALFKTLQNNSEVLVYDTFGMLRCSPFALAYYETDIYLTYEQQSGKLFLHSSTGQKFVSTNGGCRFVRDYRLLPSHYRHAFFYTSNILKLYIEQSNEFVEKPKFLWYKYGVLSSHMDHKSDKNYKIQNYYLQDSLPVSDNDITSCSLVISNISEHLTIVSLLCGRYCWRKDLCNITLSCLPMQLSCKITQVLNSTHLLAVCNSYMNKITHKPKVCKAGSWFLNEMYLTKEYQCENVTMQSSLNQIIFNQSIAVLLSQGSVLLSENFKVIVQNISKNNYATVNRLSGSLSSGEVAVCFPRIHWSIFDVLFTLDDKCPIIFRVNGFENSFVYLEVWEIKTFFIQIQIDTAFHFPLNLLHSAVVVLANPQQIDIRTKCEYAKGQINFKVQIQQKWIQPTMSTLKISLQIQHDKCSQFEKEIKVFSTCPPNKKLIFKYPKNISKECLYDSNLQDSDGIRRVLLLPTNYQPPSTKGKAIPLTKHVYNVDPSRDFYRKQYSSLQTKPQLKQCKGKLSRSLCKCYHYMEVSSLLDESDCITRVYRILFSEKLIPDLYISRENHEVKLPYPYTITELNNRSDFYLINSIIQNERTLLSSQFSSCIGFRGSGLFHFRFTVEINNVSFCNLATEIIVFCDQEPLAEPLEDLVRVGTAITFCSTLFFIFLYHFYLKK